MICFDITNKEKALMFLSNFTDVSMENITKFVADTTIQTDIYTDATKLTSDNYCNKFKIQPENIDIQNIMLCAIHYTSNNDKNQSIKEFGLRDLQFALSHNTPLNNFLNTLKLSPKNQNTLIPAYPFLILLYGHTKLKIHLN